MDEIARYRELLRRDPCSRVFAPLAEACRREGFLEEALALARDGVSNHPAYAGGRMALGRVLLDLGRVREAAAEIERATAASPGGASAWRLLGEARARLRDRSGAFEAFARALALDPFDAGARDAVLDIDSLIESLPPEAEETGPAGTEDLDLPLEVIQDGEAPPARLSEVERAWLEENELAILLVPEENGDEASRSEAPHRARPFTEEPPFRAGSLDILDIAHSSLAPEAVEEPDIEGSWIPPGEDEAYPPTSLEPGWPPGPGPEAPAPAAVPPDLRTETLADLYVQQGHVDRALEIYRAILAGNPLHLRVKKKLFDLLPAAPSTGESAADRKIAELGRWLDRARSAAERPRPGGSGREAGIEHPVRIFTRPPAEEGR